MTIRLEVLGEDATEFAKKLAGVFALTFTRIAGAGAAGVGVPAPAAPQENNVQQGEQTAETDPTPNPNVEAPTTRRRGRKATEQAAAEAKTEAVQEPEEPEPQVSQADVKAALLALLDKKGDEVPPKVLAEFGVKKLSEVKPADYAAVIARCNEEAAKD